MLNLAHIKFSDSLPHCLISLYVIHCHKRGFVLKVSAKVVNKDQRTKLIITFSHVKSCILAILQSCKICFRSGEKMSNNNIIYILYYY